MPIWAAICLLDRPCFNPAKTRSRAGESDAMGFASSAEAVIGADVHTFPDSMVFRVCVMASQGADFRIKPAAPNATARLAASAFPLVERSTTGVWGNSLRNWN